MNGKGNGGIVDVRWDRGRKAAQVRSNFQQQEGHSSPEISGKEGKCLQKRKKWAGGESQRRSPGSGP